MPFPQPDAATTARQRTDALAQFRAWAADPLALVLDTETTSLEGEVWEIAAGRVQHPTPILHLRGEPRTEWGERALQMQDTDIRDQLRGLPHLSAYAGGLAALIGNHHPLAWGDFDHPAIERTCGLQGLPEFGDVMAAYAPLAGRWSESRGLWKFVKLEEACEAEGVPVGDARTHSAPGDVLLTARLIQAVAQRLPESYAAGTETEAMRQDDLGQRLFGEPLADILDLDTWTETRGGSSSRKESN